jgi:hypothetical protein
MSPSHSFSTRALPCGLSAWLPLFSVSAYSSKPRPQLRLVPSGFSCDQPRISQPLSADCSDETIKPLQSVILDIPFVQPPCKFAGIASKVLRADVMKGSVQSALEHSPDALDAVSAGRASRVLASGMINRFVPVKESVQISKNNVIVGIQLRSNFDVAMDSRCDGLDGAFVHRGKQRAAITFPHSKHSSFSDRPTASAELFMLMFVRFLATYETLIKLNDALQLRNNFGSGTGFAEPMQNEPRGFLRDADLFGELQTADAFASGDEQVHSVEPLMQRDFTALKNGFGADSEIKVATPVAPVKASAVANGDALSAFAVGTLNTIRPEARLQVEPRCLLIGKRLKELKGADCAFAHGLCSPLNQGAEHKALLRTRGMDHQSRAGSIIRVQILGKIRKASLIGSAAILAVGRINPYLQKRGKALAAGIGRLRCGNLGCHDDLVAHDFFIGLRRRIKIEWVKHFRILHVHNVDESRTGVKNYIWHGINQIGTHVYNSQK